MSEIITKESETNVDRNTILIILLGGLFLSPLCLFVTMPIMEKLDKNDKVPDWLPHILAYLITISILFFLFFKSGSNKKELDQKAKPVSTPTPYSYSNSHKYLNEENEDDNTFDFDNPDSWLGNSDLPGYKEAFEEYAADYMGNLGPGDEIDNEFVYDWFVENYEPEEPHW